MQAVRVPFFDVVVEAVQPVVGHCHSDGSAPNVHLARADRLANRHQPIAQHIGHERDVAQAQRVLQHEQDVGFRHRTAGGEGDGALEIQVVAFAVGAAVAPAPTLKGPDDM